MTYTFRFRPRHFAVYFIALVIMSWLCAKSGVITGVLAGIFFAMWSFFVFMYALSKGISAELKHENCPPSGTPKSPE